MSKQQWKELWHCYRIGLYYFNSSIAITLVLLEERAGFPQDHVAQLAKVVLAADDTLAQE